MSESIKFNEAVDLFNAGRFKEAFCIWREMTDCKDAMYYAAYLLIKNDDIVTENRWSTAFELSKRASSLGSHEATYYCGYIREKVYGEKFYDEANNYYHKAFVNGISNAFECLRRLAEKGVVSSQSCIGWYYWTGGYGVEKNMSEAKKWSISAYENGEKYKAPQALAYIYNDEGDFEKALFYFKEAAANGNDNVFGHLGDCYRNGKGTNKDYSEAAKWYRKGAESGHTDEMFFLGRLYLYGDGVEYNIEEAVKWFNKVEASDNAARIHAVAYEYSNPENAIYNTRHTIELLELSATKGYVQAMVELGRLYFNTETEKSIKWFQSALDNGDHYYAPLYLGLIYRDRKVDKNKAFCYLKTAAKEGNHESFGPLGDCYLKGIGTDVNYSDALYWYTKGAENGHEDARLCLGFLQLQGLGCEANKGLAEKCFENVLKNDATPKSTCILGLMYFLEIGGLNDKDKGIELLKQSSQKGFELATQILGKIYYLGDGVVQDYKYAYELFKSIEGNPVAQEFLGHCHYFGHGCKKDISTAQSYFQKAVSGGNQRAAQYMDDEMVLKPYSKWDLEKEGAEFLGNLASFIGGLLLGGGINND